MPLWGTPDAGRYLREQDFDVAKMIPVAPTNDSLQTKVDLEVVRQVQERRRPEQVALARYFAHDTVFQYGDIIGPWITADKLPVTAAFFDQIHEDRYAISSQGKRVWNRPRPPLLDSNIHVCVPLPKSGSYPSGHSTQAFVWAGLLAEIFPEHRAELRDRAALVAWSRIIGGVHYPSDIVSGRMLGDQLVKEFLKVPDLQKDLTAVREEVAQFETEALAEAVN